MNQYVNDVHVAKDDAGAEIVLHFNQKNPAFDNKGHVTGVNVELVASMVMSPLLAEQLIAALSEMLEENNDSLEAFEEDRETGDSRDMVTKE